MHTTADLVPKNKCLGCLYISPSLKVIDNSQLTSHSNWLSHVGPLWWVSTLASCTCTAWYILCYSSHIVMFPLRSYVHQRRNPRRASRRQRKQKRRQMSSQINLPLSSPLNPKLTVLHHPKVSWLYVHTWLPNVQKTVCVCVHVC